MKVILTEKVAALGNIGDMINVSQGHARNYLIPRKLAVIADERQERQLADNQRRLQKKMSAEKDVAIGVKKKIDAIKLELIRRVAANGKLFGTVSALDLTKELATKGIEVEKRMIVIANPIKSLGNFEVKVKLFQEVEAQFEVKVIIDPAQAEELKLQQVAAKKAKEEAKLKAEADAKLASEQAAAEETEEA